MKIPYLNGKIVKHKPWDIGVLVEEPRSKLFPKRFIQLGGYKGFIMFGYRFYTSRLF